MRWEARVKVSKYMNKYSRSRIKLIESSENKLLKMIRGLQTDMYGSLTDFLLKNAAVENGALKKTSSNYRLALQVKKVEQQLLDKKAEIANFVIKQSRLQLTENVSYFNEFIENTRKLEAARTRATNQLLSRIGVEGNKVIGEGLLSSIIYDSSYLTAIKKSLVNAVSSGSKLTDLIKGYKTLVVGEDDKSIGMLETHFRTMVFDTFAENDRVIQNNMADELELNHFIFQGGIIKTTRPFCKQRNDRIYTRAFAEKWRDLDFKGKTDPYDPFVNLGGHNCRHSIDWISAELAELLSQNEKIDEYN
jgi:hypothetical protein